MRKGMEGTDLIPHEVKNYFKYGRYDDVYRVVESQEFFPIFISGLSRSGKTCMIQQICHELQREMMFVSITEETSMDDLLGGKELEDDNTVYLEGPVPIAMRRGMILVLDEIDLATPKCMCLQRPLEGAPITLDRGRRVIYPAEGFNIIATANTKGQGDARGKFHGSQFLSESFLDRFCMTVDHEYPPPEVEKKILSSYLSRKVDKKLADLFCTSLIEWALQVRKNYDEALTSDIVSTGRLIYIVRGFCIFGNPFTAVKYGISRFDENMKEVFYELFTKAFPLDESDIKVGGMKGFVNKALQAMDLEELNVRKKKKDWYEQRFD